MIDMLSRLMRRRLHFFGMNHSNSRISDKIRAVKGEQIDHLVYFHHGHEARVMDLDARNRVCHYKTTPFGVDGRNVREKSQNALKP